EIKWVNPRGIHLTLKFLGYVEEKMIEPIAVALEGATAGQESLTLKAECIGAFPSLKNPRVVWVGVGGETERLSLIQQRIEEALLKLGFPKEDRPFTPHLTLGRIRPGRKAGDFGAGIEHLKKTSFGPLTVTEVVLYQSVLRPDGAVYTPLKKIALQK
ncbi:MAG: RNA 2',3'-cyclic phosphodiesterase, partial [Pseudomonadota bacterium]